VSRDGEPPVNDGSGAGPRAAGGDGDEDAAFREDVRDALAGLAARLDREHERAAHREAVIDRLHEENQRLRRGELQHLLEPVRTALYRVHDQARRESGRLAAPGAAGPPDPGQTALLLAALADDVADALARLGVERFTVEPGAPYDASRHRPVAVTPVADPLRDGTVTDVRSDGFEQGGKVLRKAEVSVGKLDRGAGGAEPPEPEPSAPEAAGGAVPAGRDGAGRGETMNSGLGTDR
jgi:molecular chaperone GrpE (heat shock protein)